jgi:hypothetical protein
MHALLAHNVGIDRCLYQEFSLKDNLKFVLILPAPGTLECKNTAKDNWMHQLPHSKTEYIELYASKNPM